MVNGLVLPASIGALVLAFLVLPLLIIVPLSLTDGNILTLPSAGWSLRWYADFFCSERWLRASANSFIVGTGTAIGATLLGTLAACGIRFSRFTGKRLISGFLMLPLFVPTIVIASSMNLAFSGIHLTNSLLGLTVAHIVIAAPFVVVTVLGSLQSFDEDMLRAAQSLGASPLAAFVSVVLPLTLPAVLTGGIFAFATSLDELVIAVFITGPEQVTLPRQMFAGLREEISPVIAAVSVLVVTLSVLLLLLVELVHHPDRRLRRAEPSGRSIIK